jgi:hypothetical protein
LPDKYNICWRRGRWTSCNLNLRSNNQPNCPLTPCVPFELVDSFFVGPGGGGGGGGGGDGGRGGLHHFTVTHPRHTTRLFESLFQAGVFRRPGCRAECQWAAVLQRWHQFRPAANSLLRWPVVLPRRAPSRAAADAATGSASRGGHHFTTPATHTPCFQFKSLINFPATESWNLFFFEMIRPTYLGFVRFITAAFVFVRSLRLLSSAGGERRLQEV